MKKIHDSVTFEFVIITPAVAREMLKHNTSNRPVRPNNVEFLRQAFLRGEGATTHQGIAFDEDGALLDGQHRLIAISKMPDAFKIAMLVSRGWTRGQTFDAIDTTVARRSISDVLQVDRAIGAIASFLARTYHGSSVNITPQVARPFVEYVSVEARDLIDFCGKAVRTWSATSVRAAAVLCMKERDADHAKLVYAALVRKDFDTMPRVAQALFRASMDGRIGASSSELFARCMRAFDPANAGNTKIQIKDLASEIGAAREMLAAAVLGKAPARRRAQVP